LHDGEVACVVGRQVDFAIGDLGDLADEPGAAGGLDYIGAGKHGQDHRDQQEGEFFDVTLHDEKKGGR